MEGPIFKLHSATAIVNGKEVDIASMVFGVMSDTDPRVEKVAARIAGTTCTVKLRNEDAAQVLNCIVGAVRQYKLRQLHQNLSRYCQWPYTN
jgi:hypothetical protein